jgi:hypothetical protein
MKKIQTGDRVRIKPKFFLPEMKLDGDKDFNKLNNQNQFGFIAEVEDPCDSETEEFGSCGECPGHVTLTDTKGNIFMNNRFFGWRNPTPNTNGGGYVYEFALEKFNGNVFSGERRRKLCQANKA